MDSIPGVLELTGSTDFTEFATQLRHPILFLNYDSAPRVHPLTIQYTDIGGTERLKEFTVSVDEKFLRIDQVLD